MQPQLSVRSAKAKDLAHRLAQTEGRTIASVVERALEAYAQRHTEPAATFFLRLSKVGAAGETDTDLADLVEENRNPHPGIDL